MDIRENISLAEFTTLRLGGAARFFVTVRSLEELREAITFGNEHRLPIFLLGGGSNVLFSDAGWDGLVIRVAMRGKEYSEDTQGDARVVAAAGEPWDALVEETVAQGLWGLENLTGIPGSVGAAPIQNMGAYGVEIADVVDWVEVLDRVTNELHVLSPSECAFGYRDSIFKHDAGSQYIVTRLALRLSTHAEPKLDYKDLRARFNGRTDVSVREVADAVREIRARKFPNLTEVGTAGSFFKNPIVTKTMVSEMSKWVGEQVPSYEVADGRVKVPLAWLLERFGWKGKRVGAVGCWETQPLVLVQYGGASAQELILFAYDIMKDVRRRTAIKLEPEVRVVSPPHTTHVDVDGDSTSNR